MRYVETTTMWVNGVRFMNREHVYGIQQAATRAALFFDLSVGDLKELLEDGDVLSHGFTNKANGVIIQMVWRREQSPRPQRSERHAKQRSQRAHEIRRQFRGVLPTVAGNVPAAVPTA